MGIMQLFNLLLFWLFFGILSSYIAQRKGRRPLLWFFIGVLFGILAAALVFFLPKPNLKTGFRSNLQKKSPPSIPRNLQRSDAWLKMWYYLDPARTQKGPIEFPDLIKIVKGKEITEKTLIWGEGMAEWKPLSEVPEVLQETNR